MFVYCHVCYLVLYIGVTSGLGVYPEISEWEAASYEVWEVLHFNEKVFEVRFFSFG